jgi:hypothetical protein
MLFGLPPVVDFMIRMAFTVSLLYLLFAWLDYLYRGNNRYPRLFGALDRCTSLMLSAILLTPFRRKQGD